MSRSTDLGEIKQVELPQGTLRYRERGAGRPVVFIHGLLVNGDLWRKVVPRLSPHLRCIAPDLPLGAHEVAMKPDADLTTRGLARLIADLLETLDLRDVVLVANDSGGAIVQFVATEHAERVGAIVLTSCDAYDHFPPPLFKPLVLLAHVPSLLAFALRVLGTRPLRRLPLVFGWLTKRPIDDFYADGYLQPLVRNAGVRRDACKFMNDAHPRQTRDVATRLGRFDRPVLIAWAAEDRLFPVSSARRLAKDFPNARLELIKDCYTFVPEDQPGPLADLILKHASTASCSPATVAAAG
ncbi:MAG: alpha/beta hydrolase [Myxococcales bacterium]|jgi:pimeloyl-ACP methyl ester carboxylesterase|nr:MAG: alpha/beta hydrolase [Myxococcales bacterium]